MEIISIISKADTLEHRRDKAGRERRPGREGEREGEGGGGGEGGRDRGMDIASQETFAHAI